MFQTEMRRVPGITESERRRRIHQVYQILLSAARKKLNDAPVSKAEKPGTSASRNAGQSDSTGIMLSEKGT